MMAVLTKAEIAAFADELVAVSETAVKDASEVQYKFGDFDGFPAFLTSLNDTVVALEASNTASGVLINDLMLDSGPCRDLRKNSRLSNVGKYDYVTNENRIGYPNENYKIFVFQWALDSVGESNSLVPGAIALTLNASTKESTSATKGIAAVIKLLNAGESVNNNLFLDEVAVGTLETAVAAL